jgi:uncharacterized membrane protein YhhN
MTRLLEYLHRHGKTLKWLFFASLAISTIGDFFVPREKIHFFGDRIPGFWSLFGLGVCFLTVFVCKRMSDCALWRKEDYYDN